ncbi:hypothetical protein NA888_20825 [Escherichia coli]|nr:hypothetical protein [Escherichia coli]MEB6952490.1 hypothetical protein [Escherichia coli]
MALRNPANGLAEMQRRCL